MGALTYFFRQQTIEVKCQKEEKSKSSDKRITLIPEEPLRPNARQAALTLWIGYQEARVCSQNDKILLTLFHKIQLQSPLYSA